MKGKNVLAIDDEAIVLESIRKVLTAEGFHVTTTLSAREGIRMAGSEPYHIVLSDIRMPDLDGLTVLRDIKRSKPTLPVVIITGYATVSSAVQAMKLGAANYIEKPFTPEALARVVQATIAASESAIQEEQTLIHPKEVLKVLKKGASDSKFARKVFEKGAEALEGFNLTGNETLAIITGDADWLEDQLGKLKPAQRDWLTAGRNNLNR